MESGPTPNSPVLAVDPGRHKCGLAVVRGYSPDFEVLAQEIVPTGELAAAVTGLSQLHSPRAIVIGDGTSSRDAQKIIEDVSTAPLLVVDEKFSTLRARQLFFKAHPPKGWRKLVPLSLQSPHRPYDDFVAIILAKDYLSR